jgi:hypothetical protein
VARGRAAYRDGRDDIAGQVRRGRGGARPDGKRDPGNRCEQGTPRHQGDHRGSCVCETHETPYQCCPLLLRNDLTSMEWPRRAIRLGRTICLTKSVAPVRRSPALLPGGQSGQDAARAADCAE